MNAAINLAFRAVAAPDAVHLLHRVRSENQDGKITTVAKNAREKAAYGKKGIPISLGKNLSTKRSKSANFFHDFSKIARFDTGEILLGERKIPLASGIALWHAVNSLTLPRIVALNEERLRRLEKSRDVGKPSEENPDDDIPM